MKKILLIFIFFYSLLVGNEQKSVALQLPWKYQFQFAGYIIAKEKGFYKDSGLDVDLKEWQENFNTIENLDNGKIEYAVLRPTSMIDISKGKELIYLATIFQSSPLVLLADKSSNITSLSELKNKRVMTSGDLSADVSLLSMIFSQGLKLKDLIIQTPSFNTKDLLDSKTDLIASYISNEPYVLKELGGNPVIFNPKDFGFDFYSDILATSKKYSENQKDEVKRFKEASLKGWDYAFSNINETVEIIYKKYNSQNKSKEALIYEANELKKLAYHNTNEIGKITPEKLEKIFSIYKVLGLAQNTMDFTNIIFNDLSINKFDLNMKEKAYLEDKQPIKMCIDSDWNPYEKLDANNKYTGIGADYFSIVEKHLSTKFEVVKTTSQDETIEFIKNKKCDFSSLVIKTPKTENELKLTSTIFKVPLVIATKLDVSFINKIEDIKNKKIAISKDYVNIDYFRNKYSNLNIIEVENTKEGLKQLKEGKIYAFIGSLYSVAYKIQTEYSSHLKIAGKTSDEIEFVSGINKDDRILFDVLQKTINVIPSSQIKELIDKWAYTIYEKDIDYVLLWQIILPFFVIFLFGLFFYVKLKFLNRRLSEQKKFINTILDIQPNMIFIINDFGPIFANKFFLEFFDCKDLKEFQDKHQCLVDTFLQEELFFHLGKIKNDSSWIENILNLDLEKRIVSIIHPLTETKKVFNISVVELENEKYLISLTDISDTILKQILLEDKTNHDKLTGAFNREYYESHFKLILKEYTKEDILVFAILDIDFFKKVNDTYGHNTGDKVLKEFVNVIKKSSRNDDLLIRWGGEEFILLLKVKTTHNARKVLENIRKAIEENHFEEVEHITCSIGATIYKQNEKTEDIFQRADEALYNAKEKGRNQVIIKI
ncbi:ABC transporter substrate-binding protein [Aliarcobacter butzleri]|uniref:ABC transporter substrate-binding protein n=1 Tax=Aliarcobacter butzleri TaxID=28197 RepID=UPI0021B1D9D3|nr:ABC transporter substrate-binding protein [Aliarcobacter butzleri]MCT7647124.1 ABC transporter substrate-binding protein [Aliarcobacter butzleri]